MMEMTDIRPDLLRRVFQQIRPVDLHRIGRHPDYRRFETSRHMRHARGPDQHVAPADVDLIIQTDRYRLRRISFFQITVECNDRLHTTRPTRRQHHHPIAALDDSRSNLTGVPTKIKRWPDNILYRETHLFAELKLNRNGFKNMQQRAAAIPRRSRTDADHV